MRFFHLADLHIGKTLRSLSLIPDQRAILAQVVELAALHRPDAVLLCGDIYDRQTPPAEAVPVLDAFLTGLSELSIPVLVISGNHDSPERLGFAARMLRDRGVFLYASFDGAAQKITLTDARGEVDFYLLPYLRPALVRPHFPQEKIVNAGQSVALALAASGVDPARRNVLLAHQFVTAAGREPERSDSEGPQVGGLDSLDVSLFQGFDYVALGHLHRPQSMGGPTVRYAGSPLKYSFSEVDHEKTVSLVELGEKGAVEVTKLPLRPLRDLRRIEGPLAALLSPEVSGQDGSQDFLQVILTDPQPPVEALARLRAVYPNVLSLQFAALGESVEAEWTAAEMPETELSPKALFSAFFEAQLGAPPDAAAQQLFERLMQEEP